MPWERDLPSTKYKKIPTVRSYSQTLGRVTANEQFFKSSLRVLFIDIDEKCQDWKTEKLRALFKHALETGISLFTNVL